MKWIFGEAKESQEKGEICIGKIAWTVNGQKEEEMAAFQVNTSNGKGHKYFSISSSLFSCLISILSKIFSFLVIALALYILPPM